MRLKGQTAFVTGGAQGIGRSICEMLAREGANIAVSDINIDAAQKTSDELKASFGVGSIAVKTNVSKFEDVASGLKAALTEYGKIDILINNAGITRDTLIMRMKEEDWDLVINVNLKGVFNGIKAVSPIMMKQRSGRIISIASIVGQMGNAGQANYSASKGGVIALTKTAARELASRGVTVNAIAPGFIDTDMTKVLPDDVKDKLKAQIPMGTLGSPDDIAKAVVFLCADAPYITGQVIAINGGMYM
jgi:3-oxoacyl-[acyl-carrier protein] reductase